MARSVQREDELLWRRCGEFRREGEDEEFGNAEALDELCLVRGGGEQTRRLLRAHNAHRMRIKRDNHGGSSRRLGIRQCAANYCLVAEMDTVKHADGQKHGAGNGGEFGNGVVQAHGFLFSHEGTKTRREECLSFASLRLCVSHFWSIPGLCSGSEL